MQYIINHTPAWSAADNNTVLATVNSQAYTMYEVSSAAVFWASAIFRMWPNTLYKPT